MKKITFYSAFIFLRAHESHKITIRENNIADTKIGL